MTGLLQAAALGVDLADWVVLLIAAPFIGSFLGVLIRRLPLGRPVLLGRSACECCGHVLGPVDLVPIASFVLSRGRCRYCSAPIAWMHPAIELSAVVVPLSEAAAGLQGAALWFGAVLGWTLLALSWIDWQEMWLPDVLTLPLLPCGLAATWVMTPDALAEHAAAAVFGYLLLRLVAAVYRWRRGRDGLGGGDAKLLAAAGAWLGLRLLPDMLLAAAVSGLLMALGLRLSGREIGRTTALPFGPCLALAFWVLWLYGDRLDALGW